MKRVLVLLATIIMLLCACGWEETPDSSPDLTEEPIAIDRIALECCAGVGSDAGFPAAAIAFGETLQNALAEKGVQVGRVDVSFSRVDAATADALENGGVTLGIMGSGAALVEKGTVLLALSRNIDEPSCGLLIAGQSEYGNQLASRTKTSPLTAEEWSRAEIGAVESDRVLLAAAQQLLHESADYTLEEYRGYATVEELLAAVKYGEVDAAAIRAEDTEEYWALTDSMVLYEGAIVLASSVPVLQSDAAKQALTAAFLAAGESDAGQTFLRQYGCESFTMVTDEEIAVMRDLAIWEEME